MMTKDKQIETLRKAIERGRLKESTAKLAEENKRWADIAEEERIAKPLGPFAAEEQKQQVTKRRRQGRKASAEDKAQSDVERDKFINGLKDALEETNEALRRFGTGTEEAADAFAALGKISINEREVTCTCGHESHVGPHWVGYAGGSTLCQCIGMSEAEKVAIDKGFSFKDVKISGDGMQEEWPDLATAWIDTEGNVRNDIPMSTTSDANVMDGLPVGTDEDVLKMNGGWTSPDLDQGTGVIRIDIGEFGSQEKIDAIRCPSCGWSMSVRTAKRGKRSGQQFLGCQQYPVCMTTYNMELDDDAGGRVIRLVPNYRPGPVVDSGREGVETPAAQKVGIGTKRRRKIEL